MIASNLKVLLAERNLSILKVSKDTGISRTTLTSLCSNNAKGIQFETLETLCGYLNIMPESFFLFSPYRIMFDYDGSDQILIQIHNLISNRSWKLFCSVEIDNKFNSVYLNPIQELSSKDASEKFKLSLKELPVYYKSKLTSDLKSLLSKRYHIDSKLLEYFSIEENIY